MTEVKTEKEIVWTSDFFWVVALSLSYFFCLPLLRTGVVLGVTASEIRLYDVVFLFVLLLIILPRLSQFFFNWRNYSKAHRYLLYWVIVAFFGLLLLGIVKNEKFLIGLIRYIRFFSFSSVFVLIFMLVKNRRQLEFLYDAVLATICMISVLGTLQGLGVLPNFWPDYYSAYWDNAGGYLSTATLAPNHTHYSLVMAIGMIMVFAIIKTGFVFSIKNVFYLGSLIPMSYSMIVSQGRSGWLVLIVYILYSMLFSSGRVLMLFLIFASLFVTLTYFNAKDVNDSDRLSVQEILLYRSINTHKDLGRTSLDIFDDDERNYIERVDDNRWYIYTNSIQSLAEKPEYWLFGAGFQNASRAIGGFAVAAHNAYINIFAEHGVIGLVVYIIFLFSLLNLAKGVRSRSRSFRSHHFANEFIAFFVGMLIVNFFGEIIYPGRALFSFLGSFFVITGLLLHPAWGSLKRRV